MKICIVILVMLLFGFVGFLYKRKFSLQINCIENLIDYLKFFKDNLLLFKNDIVEINLNYIIMQKNKNAKSIIFNQNMLQNNKIDMKYLENNIYNKLLFLTIEKYFQTQGTNEYDYEIAKVKDALDVLDREIECTKLDAKNKGDLWFKILLAIGAVVAILIW